MVVASATSKPPPMSPAQALVARKNADIERDQKRAAQVSSSLVRVPDPQAFYDSLPTGTFRTLVKSVAKSMQKKNPGAGANIAFFTDAATAWDISKKDDVHAYVLLKCSVAKGKETFSLDERDLAVADVYLRSKQIVVDLRRLFEAKLHFWSDKISEKGKAGNCHDDTCCVHFRTSADSWAGFEWSRLVSDEGFLIEFIDLIEKT